MASDTFTVDLAEIQRTRNTLAVCFNCPMQDSLPALRRALWSFLPPAKAVFFAAALGVALGTALPASYLALLAR
jgi:hypothetical protein